MIITDLGMNGEGIAHDNGRTYFVPYALVGENVNETDSGFDIEKTSKDRAVPLCEFYGKCGGCLLQHLEYEKQLEFKRELVARTIKKIAGLDAEVLSTVAGEPYFYRNKFALPVGKVNDEWRVGMFERASHNLVGINKCAIVKKFNERLIEIFNQFLQSVDGSQIRYFVAREQTEGVVVCVVSKKDMRNAFVSLNKALKTEFRNYALYMCVNSNPKTILSSNQTLIAGDKNLVVPDSFVQVNDVVSKKLYTDVLAELNADDLVIDAYSGAGDMTIMFAKKCKRVYGIEIVRSAVDKANAKVGALGINNIQNICGDCAKVIPTLVANGDNIALVVDPPRTGLDTRVIDAVIKSNVGKIVYVSCNPKTLARDLKLLSVDFDMIKVTPYDMFPQTPNVETLVVLNRKMKNIDK